MILKVLDAKGKWKNIETKTYKKNIRKKKLIVKQMLKSTLRK